MLLQLENAPKESLKKLFAFAEKNNLLLSLVDANKTKSYLPGKVLTGKELKQLIEKSRTSGHISMEEAHKQIRKALHAG